MDPQRRIGGSPAGPAVLLILGVAVGFWACRAQEPALSFLDDASGLSFTHPPGWRVGFAEQNEVRYRFLTAPKGDGDREALSVTLISPTPAPSADALAAAYLEGASGISASRLSDGATEWSFTDADGAVSRLRVAPTAGPGFFGAWARGSGSSMARHRQQLDGLLGSLRIESSAGWPVQKFAGLAAAVPDAWVRGSRLSNATNATMQFKSLPLALEKTSDAIHGFVTLSRETVPPPGDLDTLARVLKDRSTDTVSVMEHRAWPGDEALGRPEGYMDYMRSGTTLTSTRIRRWISAKEGVALILVCEARVDVFDRLDPWCRRLSATARLE